MKCLSTAVAVTLLMLLPAATCPAELTPQQADAARALIAKFSAREFAVRQKAVDDLVAMGPEIVPLVQQALGTTDDAEVKLRCRLTLRSIAEKYGVEVGPDKPPRRFGLDASNVTISRRRDSLENLLDELARQSGNAVIEPPAGWGDRPVGLDVKTAPYWEALDRLCAKAGLICSVDDGTGAMNLLPGHEEPDITAYAGPVSVKFEECQYERRVGATGEFRYRFVYFCEEALKPFDVTVEFKNVVGPDGDAFTRTAAPRGRVWPHQATCFGGTVYLAFKAPPDRAGRIARLDGVVTLCFGAGRRTVTLEDVFNAKNRTAEGEGVTLRIESFLHSGGTAKIGVRREVNGKEEFLPVFAKGGPYGFQLVDPNGNRHAGWMVGDRMTPAVDSGKRFACFDRLPEVKGKWNLVCVLPAEKTVGEYPFSFTNVPLP